MKSMKVGEIILEVEVTNISPNGFWIMVDEKEYFLPFKSFPWFENARISDISLVERLTDTHLYWKNLDIDLTLDIIIDPANYPLVSK
jgi:hypothetical protein